MIPTALLRTSRSVDFAPALDPTQRWRTHAGFVAWPTVALMAAIVAGEVALWSAVLGGHLPLAPAAAVATALAYASFTVMHDASHGSIAGGEPRLLRAERALGWLAGIPLFGPFPLFRVMHLRHHAHTNDPDNDPDHWVVGGSALSVVLRCLTIFPRYYWEFQFGATGRTTAAEQARRPGLVGLVALGVAFATLAYVGLGKEALVLWLAPACLASGLLAFAFDWLPHHPHSLQERFRDTRVLLIPGITLPLLWQNYHLIHHLHPRVPFYRYARCFRDIRGFLQEQGAPIEGWGGEALARPFGSDLHTPDDGPFELEVTRCTRPNPHAVVLELRRTDGRPVRSVAGQHLRIGVPVDGVVLHRCYSLCNAPGDDPVIAIKRVPGGRVSNHLNDHAAQGMRLEATAPSGNFRFDPGAAPARLVLVGGGSGVTPLLSMARAALRDTRTTRVTVLLGNRNAEHVLFGDALDALRRQHPGRLVLRQVLDDPPEGWTGGVGRLGGENLDRQLRAVGVRDDGGVRYAICGPGPMMDAARRALTARGVSPDRITEERFVAPAAAPAEGPPMPVVYRIGGREHAVDVAAGQTFLEAARQHDVPLAWSCGAGSCGTCRMKLVSGSVEQPRTDALLHREREDGWFLGCSARPTSPCVVGPA